MAKAIHTMIRVLDLDRSIDFYGKAFGLQVADHFDFDGFREFVGERHRGACGQVQPTSAAAWCASASTPDPTTTS